LTLGELTIDKDLTLLGAGRENTIVQPATGGVRVFNLSWGNVLIANLTIRAGGQCPGTGEDGGGAIKVAAVFALAFLVIGETDAPCEEEGGEAASKQVEYRQFDSLILSPVVMEARNLT
jgi:hypothetical protein